ncbi:MAG: ABC transporter ATP-binding protein [Lachnospiraceae bacterium]|nr:ABC transporter ATP-binding protein [Lachnospiraceae bacterium]
MIKVKNLVKKYGSFLAVDHLNFEVYDGQILGFLGPNGAGKSTTMNILTGYLSPTEGDISIDGIDMFEEPEKAKALIGYLPEKPPLYLDMTVYEYLWFVAELKGVKKKERFEEVKRVIELTSIDNVKDKLIKHISKGYKQRVGVAQALIGNPKVIILDEPTVGLDPAQILEMRNLMRSLSKNHTVILSSHILSEVSEVCDTILIINSGKLIRMSSTEELLSEFTVEDEIILSVKASYKDVFELIKDIKGLKSAKEISNDGTVTTLSITWQDTGVDVKDEITFKLAANRISIVELKKEKKNLEEIFLTLVEKSNKVSDEEGEENAGYL